MPVAQDPSHHHHFFSSLGTILHVKHPHHHSAPSSSSQSYLGFEDALSQRLASLIPLEGVPFITLSSLTQAMAVVLLTEEDLRTLIPPPAQAQRTLIDEFLERSIKLIDVCNAIIEQISEVQQWKTLLEAVIQSLGDSKGSFSPGHIRRAKKAMGEIHRLLGAAEGQEEMAGHVHPHLHPSLRVSHRCAGEIPILNQLETLTLDRPKRWLSRNGNTGRLSEPARQLQVVASGLIAPKWSGGDVDESFGSAIHALNIISVFFLSTTLAALPNSGKSSTITINHPGSFLWVSYFLSMQEKVQDEIRRKGKRTRNGNLWEIGQIFSIMKRLAEVTEPAHEFPLPEHVREEIRNLVKRLRQYVEELDRDLQCLHDQIAELHNRMRSARVGLLDLFSYGSIS